MHDEMAAQGSSDDYLHIVVSSRVLLLRRTFLLATHGHMHHVPWHGNLRFWSTSTSAVG